MFDINDTKIKIKIKNINENIFQIDTATSKTMHSETRGEETDTFLLDFEVFVSKQNAVFSKIIDMCNDFNKAMISC